MYILRRNNMPFKNPEDKKKWQNDYYHKNNLKQVQTDRARLNYWRKKYCKIAKINYKDFKKVGGFDTFSEAELRDLCEKLNPISKAFSK